MRATVCVGCVGVGFSGKTEVLVGVYGPIQVSSKREQLDQATLEVTFAPLSGPSSSMGSASGFEVHYAQLIQKAMEAVIQTHLYPCSRIAIAVQVISNDGSISFLLF